MARAMWSGSISFGLVNIPVKMYTATRDKDVHFHQLHAKDMSRVKYRVTCTAEDQEIAREEIVNGYEIGPDQYVVVAQDELDNLAPEKSRRIDITDFVDMGQIDPLYFERPYYLLPDEQAAKAYKLLVEAMTRSGKVAVARFVMRNKEYLAALRPMGGALCIETMRFADEVTLPQELEGVPQNVKIDDRELKMAEQLIGALSGEFEPQKYRDDYRDRVQDLIQKKAEGQEVVVQPAAAETPKVIDLMAALKKSLASARKAAPEHAEAPHRRKRRKTA